MNDILLEKMNKFLSEATPDSILNNCIEYGCKVRNVPQYSLEETREMVKNWHKAKEKNKGDFNPIIIDHVDLISVK